MEIYIVRNNNGNKAEDVTFDIYKHKENIPKSLVDDSNLKVDSIIMATYDDGNIPCVKYTFGKNSDDVLFYCFSFKSDSEKQMMKIINKIFKEYKNTIGYNNKDSLGHTKKECLEFGECRIGMHSVKMMNVECKENTDKNLKEISLNDIFIL